MSLLETVDWPKAAEEFSRLVCLDDFHAEVVDFLLQNLDKPWAIACSGGCDSLSLLLLVYGHFPQKRGGVFVFHYNHKVRGAESDEEASFVEFSARSLGLPFILGEGGGVDRNKSEAYLRKKRHEFFTQALKEIDGNILLLGHQRDDVAETMLMRLARGSGTGGLCAPRPLHHFSDGKVHLRPLINIGKERLLGSLEALGVPWCNDSSNEGEFYLRNRIRRNVIPDWVLATKRDLWKGIERSRSLLEEDDLALENWLERVFKDEPIKGGRALNVILLAGLPKALYRRCLHKWLGLNEISQYFSAISFSFLLDRVMNFQSMRMSVGRESFVSFDGVRLILEEEKSDVAFSETVLESGSQVFLPNGRLLEAEEIFLTVELRQLILKGKVDPGHEVYLNYDKKEDLVFFVRLWAPGDRYRALGSPGTRKLQDMFTDKKISLDERRRLPIIGEYQRGIVWCPGLAIAEPLKIEDNTQCALKLTFR